MTTNLINRTPIPGSLGAPVDQGIDFQIQTTGTVSLATVQVYINSVLAYGTSAFKTGFTGSATADGFGGWVFSVLPTVTLPYDTVATVQVLCTEEPGAVAFNQTYSFRTIRNIKVSVNAEYSEAGDVVNLTIYTYEGTKKVPAVISKGTCKIYAGSSVPSVSGTLVDTFTFDNERNGSSSDGVFNVRFLHPLSVNSNMTYEVSLVSDPYQAPSVGTIVERGTIIFVPKKNDVFIGGHKQPDVQGDINLPRIEYEGKHNQSFQIDEADYEKVDMAGANELPDILVDLDFLNGDNYINIMNGDVTYTGGGNRLLRNVEDPTTFTLQATDDLPPHIGGRLLAEPTATNFFPNSALIDITNPFTTAGTDNKVLTESSIRSFINSKEEIEVPLVNQLHFVFEGLSTYDGTTRHATATSPKVSYASGNDILISSLVRITYRDSTVTLTNFKLIAKFYNNANTVVYSETVTYSPADFVSDNIYSMAEVFVASGSIPGTATKVGFMIDFDSFEACDRIEVFMAGPSIEYAQFTTSRTVAETATALRLPDTLTIGQANNLNVSKGMVVIEYVPMYDGAPPVAATMFDSRLTTTLFNGFVATHRVDGFVEFSIVDQGGTVQSVVSGSAVSLAIGENVTFNFLWDTASIGIKKGTTSLASFSGAYTLPNGINTALSIGSDANGNNHLLSEIIRFLIYSRPLS